MDTLDSSPACVLLVLNHDFVSFMVWLLELIKGVSSHACPALLAIRLKKRRPRSRACVYFGVKVIGGSDKEKEEFEEEDFDDAGV